MNCVCFGKKQDNFSITFELRGVDLDMANSIWHRMAPKDIQEATKLTGHNLWVWEDGLSCEIKKTKSNNYVVMCGRTIGE